VRNSRGKSWPSLVPRRLRQNSSCVIFFFTWCVCVGGGGSGGRRGKQGEREEHVRRQGGGGVGGLHVQKADLQPWLRNPCINHDVTRGPHRHTQHHTTSDKMHSQ
jgi:hypothetical protein